MINGKIVCPYDECELRGKWWECYTGHYKCPDFIEWHHGLMERIKKEDKKIIFLDDITEQ